MFGWMRQWYGYVPTVGKVRTNAWFGASDPDSHPAASDVLVCGILVGSQFTHATLPPAFTCTLAGTNRNERMNTKVLPATFDGVVQLVVSIGAVEVERSETQALRPAASTARTMTTLDARRRVKDRCLI